MEENILRRKFIDTEIKLINIDDLSLYDIEQICCSPIISVDGLFFICEVRKKNE